VAALVVSGVTRICVAQPKANESVTQKAEGNNASAMVLFTFKCSLVRMFWRSRISFCPRFRYALSLNSFAALVRPILRRSFSLIGQVSNQGTSSRMDS
jgi:hypothetical protein